MFDGFLCLVVSQQLFVATRVLLWIPLGLSLMLAVASAYYIRRFYHRHQSIMLSGRNFPLILRLGAMACMICSTAVFFSFISASSNQNRPRLAQMSIFWQGMFELLFFSQAIIQFDLQFTSAISTLLEFFIFIEPQVLSVWKSWAYRLVGRQLPTAPPAELEFSTRQDGAVNPTL